MAKIGLRVGGGRPPGYRWNVVILEQAFHEAREFLDDDQYEHLADQVRELARQDDPTHSISVDVRSVEELWEIRDKGGILLKINARIFFFVHKSSRTIVVLGAINKKNDGQTPLGDKRRMQSRKRQYLLTIQSNG